MVGRAAPDLPTLILLPAPLMPVRSPSQEASTHLSSYIPKVAQFFVLRSYGEQLQTAMLQLLQDKDACDWLLQERSDTSAKRRFLKERLSRLAQARRQLAKFPG